MVWFWVNCWCVGCFGIFTLSEEENNTINYLDISIHSTINSIGLEIYMEPTLTDVTLQFSTNHPLEHELQHLIFT